MTDNLLSRFDRWREHRAELSATEPETDPDLWAQSDDEGCELASEFAAILLDLLPTLHAIAALNERVLRATRTWRTLNENLSTALERLGVVEGITKGERTVLG